MSKPTCVICVTFVIKPEHFQEFLTAIKLQAKNSIEKEAWCHQFDVATSADRPNTVLLYETYDDRAAIDKHRETEHFATFSNAITDWVESKDVHVWDIETL